LACRMNIKKGALLQAPLSTVFDRMSLFTSNTSHN
jgi:hypothetical protein